MNIYKYNKFNENISNPSKITSIVSSFDYYFGSNYQSEFQGDYRILTNKDSYTSQNVIDSLISEVNINNLNLFSLESSLDGDGLDDLLYQADYLYYQHPQKIDNILNTIEEKLNTFPKVVAKEKFFYLFFKKFSKYFTPQVIKDELEIKHSYDVTGTSPLDKKMQSRIITSLTNSFQHYQQKVKKGKYNLISSDKVIKFFLLYFLKSSTSETIKDVLQHQRDKWLQSVS